MRYAVATEALATQSHRLDAATLALGGDDDGAHGGIYLNALEAGCGDGVVGLTWAVGVEAYHREYGPRRHRSRVVITWQAVGRSGVVLVELTAYLELCEVLIALDARKEVGVGDIWLVGRVPVDTDFLTER